MRERRKIRDRLSIRSMKNSLIRRLFLLGVMSGFPLLLITLHAEEARLWNGNAGTVEITPGESMWMAGYAARKRPYESVLEPLFAKVLYLEDSDQDPIVVVTLDWIGVPRSFRNHLEEKLAERLDLSPHRLLLNASHTHSGPMVRVYEAPDGTMKPAYSNIPDEEAEERVESTLRYVDSVLEKIELLVSEVREGRKPVAVSFSKARCGFAINRRTPVGPGKWKNAPNPEAPVDHEVPVLQVRDEQGDLLAVLFGYACHATVLSGMEINGDWPGFAQKYFEEDHPGVIAMFLNGCSGDQNPYPRRMLHYAQRHGRAMATAVEAALETPAQILSPRSGAALHWEPIRYQEPPTPESLKQRSQSSNRYEARYAAFLLEVWKKEKAFPESYPVPVQVLRLGDEGGGLTLVALGGEVVVDYSLRLKREWQEQDKGTVWVAGYSNDVMTYIPSRRVLMEGGYEGGEAMRFVRSAIHPAPWVPEIEEQLVRRVHLLHDQLRTVEP